MLNEHFTQPKEIYLQSLSNVITMYVLWQLFVLEDNDRGEC
jgi:hypothetical protein